MSVIPSGVYIQIPCLSGTLFKFAGSRKDIFQNGYTVNFLSWILRYLIRILLNA